MTEETQASAIPPQPQAVPAKPPLTGIGGWLILVMLGMFGSIGLQLVGLTSAGDTFGILGNLSGPQANLVVIEFIANLVIFLAWPIALLVLFFNKDRKFPRLYIWWMAVSAVFVFLDLAASYIMFHDVYEAGGTSFFDRDTLRSMGGALAGVCIWIPYMVNSVRVKNTFVK
jgi:hypothetical protein